MKLTFFLLISMFIMQVEAQEYLCNWPDSLIQQKAKKIVRERTIEFNKNLDPVLFENENQLLDSLKQENINHMVTYFDFSAFDENMENPALISGRSTTMDIEIPFIRYKYERSEQGDIIIIVIQGHNNW